jgi:uncharacterized RDD family membrane protein YckC
MLQPRLKKLDCSVRVITPENIEFEYELAGPFQRLPAFAFDIAVRIAVFLTGMFILSIATTWLGIAGGLVTAVIGFLGFFLFSWFYGIYFETRYNGRTLGKMVFKLRVISVDGRPINGIQAGLRNLLRPADMALPLSIQIFDPEAQAVSLIPTFIVGFVAMLLTQRYQRLGDLAAGTMVISEHRKRSPWNMQPEDLRAFGLSELLPATFPISSSLAQTTGLYMENRLRLSPARRTEVAKHVACPLIKKFDLLPDTSPDLFLCALYVRIFLSEGQQAQGKERLRLVSQQQRLVPPPVRAAFVRPTATPVPQPTKREGASAEGASAEGASAEGASAERARAGENIPAAITSEPILPPASNSSPVTTTPPGPHNSEDTHG